MRSRLHEVLSRFGRSSKVARLNRQMFGNIKTTNINGNGTSGYLIKKGKNSGTVLKHIKNNSEKI